MRVRKDLTYLLHTLAGFGTVGVIRNQYGRKPTLPVIHGGCGLPYHLPGNSVDEGAPVDVVLGHERIQDVLATPEHIASCRTNVMGQPPYGHERQQHQNLEDLQIGQLIVPKLVASKVPGVQPESFQYICEVFQCAVSTFFGEKIADF